MEAQAELDAQMKADGFVDLEDGADMADFGASTFPGGADYQQEFDRIENAPGPVVHMVKDGKPCDAVIPIKPRRRGRKRKPHRSLEAFGDQIYQHQTEFGDEEGQQLGLTAASDYQFWCFVGQAVHDLPDGTGDLPAHPHLAFLTDLAESGELEAARKKHGLTRSTARWAFKKLLERCGLGQSGAARNP